MRGSIKVTKREWYDVYGGLTNSRCWRRQNKSGVWSYYVTIEG